MNDFSLVLQSVCLKTHTVGKLFICHVGKDPEFFCFTLERPWLGNKAHISCIPYGEYVLKSHKSPKFGRCYYLQSRISGVVGLNYGARTHILIHPANRASELHGCIALGSMDGILSGEFAILNSRKTVNKLHELLGGRDTLITIMER